MAQRTLFIVNPTSSSGRTQNRVRHLQKEILSKFDPADIAFTERPGHATELARAALKDKVNLIVAVGGDGTVNEVANGFFENGLAINDSSSMAVLMSGTGGDFRRSIGWPKNIEDGLHRIEKGSSKRIDVGFVQSSQKDGSKLERYFLNVASIGLSAKVAGLVSERRGTKNRFAYFRAALSALKTHKPSRLEIIVDGRTITLDQFSLVAFANAAYFGGDMHVAPNASLTDGLANIIAISEISIPFLLRHALSIYRGTHLSLPQVQSYQGIRMEIPTVSSNDISIETDGEPCGQLPATFQILKSAINLIQ